MDQEAIFVPFFGIMLLTIVVWVYMYYLRLSVIRREKIDPQTVATTRHVTEVIPDRLNTPSENLVNLFELPVLFYVACLYLYVTHRVDGVYLALAYLFLLFRIAHSAIHCTYNRVVHRFVAYMISSLALWAIVVRAFVGAVRT